MDYVIEITGGIGKQVMATSLIRWVNQKFPKNRIIVVSTHPEIFEYNPRIYRNLRIDQPYLFEDYIKDSDYRKGNPYELKEFYRSENKLHLMKIFPKAYGFNEIDKSPKSEIYLTKIEKSTGDIYCQQNKPLITLHAMGGFNPGQIQDKTKIESSQRDMPKKLVYKIVEILKRNGFNVLQLRTKEEPQIPGCLQLEQSFRDLMPIMKSATAHIGIDSSWMHVAGCFKKPMLTFWGGTHKDSFGYNHKGSFHAYTKDSMHGRPYFAVHDRAAMYPYKSASEGLEMNYTDKEVETYVKELLTYINNKDIK